MKKIASTLAIVLIAMMSFAQDTTLVTGSYGSFVHTDKFKGDIIVAQNAIVTIAGTLSLPDGASLKVKSGASLLLPNGLTTNAQFNVESGASVLVTGDLSPTHGQFTFDGSVTVTRNTIINGGTIVLNGACTVLKTSGFQFTNDNILDGQGLLYVTGTYSNQGDAGWSGHPLTNSNNIFINSNTTLNIGRATHTNSQGACLTTTPITLTKFSAQLDKEGNITFTWGTMLESNLDHFEIENTSDTAHHFIVATVKSQAVGGNSTQPINYNFTLFVASMSTAGIGWIFALMIAGGLLSKRKQFLVTVCLIGIIGVSCTKTNSVHVPVKSNQTFRLRSIDKDGTAAYYNTVAIQVTK